MDLTRFCAGNCGRPVEGTCPGSSKKGCKNFCSSCHPSDIFDGMERDVTIQCPHCYGENHIMTFSCIDCQMGFGKILYADGSLSCECTKCFSNQEIVHKIVWKYVNNIEHRKRGKVCFDCCLMYPLDVIDPL